MSTQEVRGLSDRASGSVLDASSLLSTRTREQRARFAHAETSRIKPSQSRSQRKQLRALKQAGVHPWEQHHGLAVRPLDTRPDPTPVDASDGPKKARLAASFGAILKDLGLDGYVSGGAALSWHGGGRPIDDLDFRIPRGAQDIGNFEDPQGRALLAALNDHNRTLRGHGYDVGEWRALGGGGLTIACDDYCGVEVSVSLTHHDPTPTPLRPPMDPAETLTVSDTREARAALHPEASTVSALTLPELQADKLKSMISRWKWGADSIKKTSQDLYDLLDAVALDTSTDPNRAIDRAIDARVDDYRRSNPFHTKLDHVDREVLRDEMLAFVTLMAREHTRGPRGKAFAKLAAANPETAAARTRALRALSERRPSPRALTAVRPWIAEWRDREGPTGKRMGAAMPKIERQAGVDEIMSRGVLEGGVPAGRSSRAHLDQVLTVLVHGDGFRPLADSHNGFQTQLAFGLSPNQFGKAYRELNRAGLVAGRRDGLHLTPAGRTHCGLT